PAPEPSSQPVDPAPQPTPAPAPPPPVPPPEPPAAAPSPQPGVSNLELRRLGQWSYTGIREARRMVIRDQASWSQFWPELRIGDQPQVDFTRNVVIAVAAGQHTSGGHEIAVERASFNDGELTVHVLETSPGPDCMTTAALTQPVDVVVVPAAGARSWSFVERREARSCR
ncbi:MAG: protease complex subunit PrcB family protein, partial [Gemmatimonadales bacterium]